MRARGCFACLAELGLILLVALWPERTLASELYRITIIAESSQQASSDWRILGRSVGINNAGVVT